MLTSFGHRTAALATQAGVADVAGRAHHGVDQLTDAQPGRQRRHHQRGVGHQPLIVEVTAGRSGTCDLASKKCLPGEGWMLAFVLLKGVAFGMKYACRAMRAGGGDPIISTARWRAPSTTWR
jgi:hypothetical protein